MAYKRFTDEEIQKANDLSIVNYIRNLNLNTKRAGKTLKLEGYGGLYINPTSNKWNCFSQGKGGGPIQLVMFLENKTWVEAVKTLLGNSYESNLERPNYSNKQIEEKVEFILPEKNNTYNHIIAYLIKTRGIDKDIVYNCIHNKTLYEDKNRNCVFVGYDKEGVARYAGLRGTNTNRVFKGEVENSNKAFSFNIPGKTNKLYVFESPIESMSYLTLQKLYGVQDFNHHMLSLACLAPVALDKYLKENQNIEEINLCLNNDKWGIKAANEIKGMYQDKIKVNVEFPKLKDWNENLVYYTDTIKKTDKLGKLEVAKNLITDFVYQECGEEFKIFDYDNIERVGIAHTRSKDEEYDIDVEIDLVNYKINKFTNGNLLHSDEYKDMDSLIEELKHLSFDDLVYRDIQDRINKNQDEWEMEL